MSNCNHQWKSYVGLNQAFEYCSICDVKKDDKIHGPEKVYLPGSRYEVTLPVNNPSASAIIDGIDIDDTKDNVVSSQTNTGKHFLTDYESWRKYKNEQAKRTLSKS